MKKQPRSRNPALMEWAKKTFEEYQAKKYIRKLTLVEVSKHTLRMFYLSHFIVVKKQARSEAAFLFRCNLKNQQCVSEISVTGRS